MKKLIKYSKRLLIIPPVIVGIIIVTGLVKNKKAPSRSKLKEKAYFVEVIKLKPVKIIPKAKGYGTVAPSKTWRMVPQVSGQITYLDPNFKKGAFFKANKKLIQIDPQKYKLAIASSKSKIENINAKLEELKMLKENYDLSLQIEIHTLKLFENDVKRQEKLLHKGTQAEYELELAKQKALNQKSKVQNLKNSLKLLPSQEKALKAELALAKVQLEQSRLDLANTIIYSPFNCRIDEVNVEKLQFVQQGQKLATAYDIDVAEIIAQFPMNRIRPLINPGKKLIFTSKINIGKRFQMSAKVRLNIENIKIEWKGRFARINSELNTKTRTVGFIIAVDDPYKKAIPGIKPPLTKGMFCEVEISSSKQEVLAIPHSAYHGGYVYIVDSNKRLRREKINIKFRQDNFIVIDKGIKEGDVVIVSDVVPAIEGMLLKTVDNKQFYKKIAKQVLVQEGSK